MQYSYNKNRVSDNKHQSRRLHLFLCFHYHTYNIKNIFNHIKTSFLSERNFNNIVLLTNNHSCCSLVHCDQYNVQQTEQNRLTNVVDGSVVFRLILVSLSRKQHTRSIKLLLPTTQTKNVTSSFSSCCYTIYSNDNRISNYDNSYLFIYLTRKEATRIIHNHLLITSF
jgi:hypothetical protein